GHKVNTFFEIFSFFYSIISIQLGYPADRNIDFLNLIPGGIIHDSCGRKSEYTLELTDRLLCFLTIDTVRRYRSEERRVGNVTGVQTCALPISGHKVNTFFEIFSFFYSIISIQLGYPADRNIDFLNLIPGGIIHDSCGRKSEYTLELTDRLLCFLTIDTVRRY